MSYTSARDHASSAKKWADSAMGQTTDQAIINLAKAVSELAQSQYDMAQELYNDQ